MHYIAGPGACAVRTDSTSPLYLVIRTDVRRLARVRAVTSWFSDLIARHASRIQRI